MSPAITQSRFTSPEVDRICNPVSIAFMRKAILDKPEVTPEELAAFNEAVAFAHKWNNEKHEKIFIHEFVAKHCNTLLAIRLKHFRFHSFLAAQKGWLTKKGTLKK